MEVFVPSNREGERKLFPFIIHTGICHDMHYNNIALPKVLH